MLWAPVIAYFALLFFVAHRSGSQSDTDQFLMANRNASPSEVGAGLFTLIGGGEFVTLASLGFLFGYSAIALFVGYAGGFLFLAATASRLRQDSGDQKFLSLPDYIHYHFGPVAGGAVFLFSFGAFFALLMLQFSSAGAVVAPFVPLSETQVIVLTALAVLGYLLLGGFRAVLTTDVVQGIAMIALLPALAFVIYSSSGVDTTLTVPGSEGTLPVSLWISLVLTGFFVVTASADVWQRVYAASTDSSASRGLVLGAAGFIAAGLVIVTIGIIARELGATDPDTAFVAAMTEFLPEGWSVLVALLVLSAMMSTADTEIFLLTGLVQRELGRSPRQARNTNSLARLRLLMVLITTMSVVFALQFRDLVGTYTWLLTALVVISPFVLASLFIRIPSRYMVAVLALNTALLLLSIGTGVATLDNAYVLGVFGLGTYGMAVLVAKRSRLT